MAAHKVDLGENKAISLLTFDDQRLELGAVVLIPSRYDKQEDKTYYHPLGMRVTITQQDREAIVKMLGGVMKSVVEANHKVKL